MKANSSGLEKNMQDLGLTSPTGSRCVAGRFSSAFVRVVGRSILVTGLTLGATSALSQTLDQPIDSIRTPYSISITYGGQFQMETISPTTLKSVLTGTAVKLPSIDFISTSVLFMDLVGNKTVPTTISGVRGTFTITPSVTAGWEQVSPLAVRIVFKTPVTLPAASFLGCRYDMPSQTFDPLKAVWSAVPPGNFKCAVGIKAATLSPPAPIAVGIVTPPSPVPTPGTSPDCTKLSAVNPTSSLTDSRGSVYTAFVPATTNNPQEIGLRRDDQQVFGAVRYAYVFNGQACVQDDLSPGDPTKTVSCFDAPSNTWLATGAPPVCP